MNTETIPNPYRHMARIIGILVSASEGRLHEDQKRDIEEGLAGLNKVAEVWDEARQTAQAINRLRDAPPTYRLGVFVDARSIKEAGLDPETVTVDELLVAQLLTSEDAADFGTITVGTDSGESRYLRGGPLDLDGDGQDGGSLPEGWGLVDAGPFIRHGETGVVMPNAAALRLLRQIDWTPGDTDPSVVVHALESDNPLDVATVALEDLPAHAREAAETHEVLIVTKWHDAKVLKDRDGVAGRMIVDGEYRESAFALAEPEKTAADTPEAVDGTSGPADPEAAADGAESGGGAPESDWTEFDADPDKWSEGQVAAFDAWVAGQQIIDTDLGFAFSFPGARAPDHEGVRTALRAKLNDLSEKHGRAPAPEAATPAE